MVRWVPASSYLPVQIKCKPICGMLNLKKLFFMLWGFLPWLCLVSVTWNLDAGIALYVSISGHAYPLPGRALAEASSPQRARCQSTTSSWTSSSGWRISPLRSASRSWRENRATVRRRWSVESNAWWALFRGVQGWLASYHTSVPYQGNECLITY